MCIITRALNRFHPILPVLHQVQIIIALPFLHHLMAVAVHPMVVDLVINFCI